MEHAYRSIIINLERCNGCTNCSKVCPNDAIVVNFKKAAINFERCIECGECVRSCPQNAVEAESDDFEKIFYYQNRIVVPDSSFYGQFRNIASRDELNWALLQIGFTRVYNISEATKIVLKKIKKIIGEKPIRPLFSSICPVVSKLIRTKFPTLIDNCIDVESPLELAAKLAREESERYKGNEVIDESHLEMPYSVRNFHSRTGKDSIYFESYDNCSHSKYKSNTGIFLLSPCVGRCSSIKNPINMKKSNFDGTFSIVDIHDRILRVISNPTFLKYAKKENYVGDVLLPNDIMELRQTPKQEFCSYDGDWMDWAISGDEAKLVADGKALSVDGIYN